MLELQLQLTTVKTGGDSAAEKYTNKGYPVIFIGNWQGINLSNTKIEGLKMW